MSMLRAVVRPSSRETRVLVEEGCAILLRARLGPLDRCHPAALSSLLEALALWQGRRLAAVLAVDARRPSWPWTTFRRDTERVTLETCLVGPRTSLTDLATGARLYWEHREEATRDW